MGGLLGLPLCRPAGLLGHPGRSVAVLGDVHPPELRQGGGQADIGHRCQGHGIPAQGPAHLLLGAGQADPQAAACQGHVLAAAAGIVGASDASSSTWASWPGRPRPPAPRPQPDFRPEGRPSRERVRSLLFIRTSQFCLHGVVNLRRDGHLARSRPGTSWPAAGTPHRGTHRRRGRAFFPRSPGRPSPPGTSPPAAGTSCLSFPGSPHTAAGGSFSLSASVRPPFWLIF